MATITLLEKARQGRRNAIASLATRQQRNDTMTSIFDFVFDEAPAQPTGPAQGSNVIAFRSARRAAAPAPRHITPRRAA
ncbi:hypothetical protein [Sinisalibacter lacisalsi]|uniref:Uncharacterized protein n=1 Tax=Sinisalibacter lacisalsi TaxID=1526570 RepID=A0ABQ1QP62_9RHOB|nr:hypothetical protein [Sinisalibacter lacisalsi]GGD37454.1 hypothetical protein GCM10011358_21530 [Sinisalibacter lacisalsi]